MLLKQPNSSGEKKSGAHSLKLTIDCIPDNFCLSIFGQDRNWADIYVTAEFDFRPNLNRAGRI